MLHIWAMEAARELSKLWRLNNLQDMFFERRKELGEDVFIFWSSLPLMGFYMVRYREG